MVPEVSRLTILLQIILCALPPDDFCWFHMQNVSFCFKRNDSSIVWARYLASLYLCFLIYKLNIIQNILGAVVRKKAGKEGE